MFTGLQEVQGSNLVQPSLRTDGRTQNDSHASEIVCVITVVRHLSCVCVVIWWECGGDVYAWSVWRRGSVLVMVHTTLGVTGSSGIEEVLCCGAWWISVGVLNSFILDHVYFETILLLRISTSPWLMGHVCPWRSRCAWFFYRSRVLFTGSSRYKRSNN